MMNNIAAIKKSLLLETTSSAKMLPIDPTEVVTGPIVVPTWQLVSLAGC